MNTFNKLSVLFIVGGALAISSCKKDKAEEVVPSPSYEVPATYNFTNASYLTSTQRVKMMVELNSYLGTANKAVITAVKANDYFSNTNAPFTDASLNTSGINLAEKTSDTDLFKDYFTNQAINSNSNTVPATKGIAGIYTSGTTVRLVGTQGLEYNQAVAKGMMGALLFKEAVNILDAISSDDNTLVTNGTTAMQRHWDEAFGYLGIPVDYDTSKTYANTDNNRPLLWGGYLAERGKNIQAGGIIFEAFRKGRAAIDAKDLTTVAKQAIIIQDKWEQLAAAAAYAYVSMPTSSANVGNLATQFHALSEGYGFVHSLKYRASHSKLSAGDYQTLVSILGPGANFYDLVNESGFAKLVQAQTILKATYGLNY